LYTLLALNYLQHDDCLFRFDYSEEFLQWALTTPGYRNELCLGVRASASKNWSPFSEHPGQRQSKIQGTIRSRGNYKTLRAKRLAPVLIKEITRRVNQTGVFQAVVYTACVVLSVPVGFSRLNPRMTMARMR
jgi:glycylpeptide N-tetradecanoyltransferase